MTPSVLLDRPSTTFAYENALLIYRKLATLHHFTTLTLIYSKSTALTLMHPKLATLYLVDLHLPQVNLLLLG